MLPEPISPDRREDVIAHMAARLLGAYRHFERIGKPGLVAAFRNLGAASPSSGATIPARVARERSTSAAGGDGELRGLTDAFRSQDFALEAAIHAGMVTAL